MKAELVPDNGDPPIVIDRDLTVVGRRGFCDVTIDHPSLSKRHCVLVKTDGLLVVRDLGSTNGTKVKGQKIRWAALLPDDRLTLGGYKMRVYLGPDSAPGPSEKAQRGPSSRASKPTGGSKGRDGGASGFAPPSPLGTPTIKPSASWPVDPDGEGGGTSGSWREQMGALVDRDDLIIELD
ncbi:FHA domain-containing protein [Singulisphaera acidiphila]|uniref:FHA domain-containing protein n=1 Tax=Singulisphaera acidiphila (strain ATCC BAA-1392 / DSM 18658 / VKM B-2454 / MOB10) TaxID=886293 RepID=L0DNE8_SINAD|nr:FHA domain-containing protein [Singulisphaera acidiphila]AGA30787.1 FHA domain-containing protein [Singulisphaera acidiphila DSM 18658]